MRILILGDSLLNSAFKILGCEVFTVGNEPDCDVHCAHPMSALAIFEIARDRGFTPDVVLYCDSGKKPLLFALEKLPSPSAFWSIRQFVQSLAHPLRSCF